MSDHAAPARRSTRLLARLGVAGVALVVLFGLALAVQAYRIRQAAGDLRSEVQAVRGQLDQVGTAEGSPDADAEGILRRLQERSATLDGLTSSVPWRIGAHVPGLAAPFRTTQSMAADTRTLTDDVLPVAVETALAFQHDERVGALDLRSVSSRSARIDAAGVLLKGVQSRREQDSTLGPLAAAHDDLTGSISSLRSVFRPLAVLAEVAGPMSGEQGLRRYLVVLQQPAEIRGAGGLVGGFVEIEVDKGAVRVVRDGSNRQLLSAPKDPLAVGDGFDETWGVLGAQRAWFASNYSPHFPSVARVWAALYGQQIGAPVDGVVAVTPEAMAGLLKVTGPLVLPDGTRLTSADAARFLEVGLYARFPRNVDSTARDEYQLQILRGLIGNLLTPKGLPPAALGAFRTAVTDGAVRLASLHPEEQATLEQTAIAGALPRGAGPFVAWVSNNFAGTKLDVYVKRRLSYAREALPDGRERVTATALLTNTAPVSGLPEYATLRPDLTSPGALGANKTLVSTYLTSGAQIVSVTLDGRPVEFRVSEERGHPVVSVTAETAPGGGTAELVVTADQRARPGPVETFQQPTPLPDELSLPQ
ncbi:MAG: putative rane protein [Frankiales bacterium]|nr:putative rane protein [Frankiales bacterium]